MNNFGDALGNFGTTTIGTISDLIEAYGMGAVNQSQADQVAIQNAQSQILINEAQAAADIEAKKNVTQLLNVVAYIAIALIASMVAANIYKSLQ